MNDNNDIKHMPCDLCNECLHYNSCKDKGCLKYCDNNYLCDILCDNVPCKYYIGGDFNA